MKALRLIVLALFVATQQSNAQVPIYNSYPSATAVLFLDFDGHLLEGTNWNWDGPIYCGPSNMNDTQIAEVFNRVAEDYRPFNINVTTDSTVYDAAPITQRMRVVLTITSDWYGVVGGVAYANSFTWGNNTPCFVFTALHRYNVKNIAEAASHEAGHTLGLRHQATYDSTCAKTSDYNSGIGDGVEGWAPIMGVGYYRNNTTWHYGPNPYACNSEQDDLAIITSERNGFGYRTDDDTAIALNEAALLNADSNRLTGNGLISTNTDTDLFKFVMPANGPITIDVNPYSIAPNDEGSNLDVQVQLYNASGALLSTYNPSDRLSAVIDTTLTSGMYYVAISGASTPFASNYASLGAYSINGSVPVAGPVLVHLQTLKNTVPEKEVPLNWTVEADAAIENQVLERSDDGTMYYQVASLSPDVRTYAVHADKVAQYRLHVFVGYDRQYFSNSITIQKAVPVAKPQLQTNVIHSNTLQVTSPVSYTFVITDVAGQVLQRGEIKEGTTLVNTGVLRNGLYIIAFQNKAQRFTEKFVRQ